tara:strand:- start:18882 stop:19193 length:312 start_codon:yes stop_codon:yes gene_type:complete
MVFQRILHTLGLILRKKLEYLLEFLPKSSSVALEQEKQNPQSVRSATTGKKIGGRSLKGKMSAEQWGQARVYSFVMKQSGTWGKADKDLADQVRGMKKTKKKK